VINPRWRLPTGSTHILITCAHDSNAIPTDKPMFSESSSPTFIPTILSDLTGSDKSKMVAANLELLKSPLLPVTVTQFKGLNRSYLYFNSWMSDSSRSVLSRHHSQHCHNSLKVVIQDGRHNNVSTYNFTPTQGSDTISTTIRTFLHEKHLFSTSFQNEQHIV